MSIARHHNEWLSLLEISGPFLSMPVLLRAFPQGLEALDKAQAAELRLAYEEWQDNQSGLRPEPAIHAVWVRYVLERLLGFERESLLEGPAIPPNLRALIAEQGETLLPDLAIAQAGQAARLLVQVYPAGQGLDKALHEKRWKASPAMRMMELLRATGVPLGLATNGEQWMLVHAPRGETSAFISWYAALWFDEPLTLRAFGSLLGAYRFFSVGDEETPEGLLKESVNEQQEVTDQLGYQVRRAVEVLIRALDKADQDRGRRLLQQIGEADLYEAALTVMMRLVFLFSAEERGLLLLGEPLYDQNYAISTLRAQLHETAEQQGEEVLERRFDAWGRLLATFRAVYGGIRHDRLNLPAYGGSLFDPDRYPFLEGRPSPPNRASLDRPLPQGERGSEPLPISNRAVLHLLDALQVLRVKVPGGGPAEPRRLSFRSLDVEQIGHVYEGLLDHVAVRAEETVLGLAGSKDKEPEIPLSLLQAARLKGEAHLADFLVEQTGRSAGALKKALQVELDAFESQRLQIACNNDAAAFQQVLPFAGLLREDDFGYPTVFLAGSVYVTQGSTRRATGTHYTPRSLTEPIVQHTLEPLVYVGPAEGLPREQWRLRPPRELLALKVCDMAMGSAGFLVQVIRYLSERLVEAWEGLTPGPSPCNGEGRMIQVTPEGEMASGHPGETIIPRDDEERLVLARRLVADRCIYGVDKNPLAVEIAKLSIWLTTMDKGRPFTFLDHALKCGDSLVGASQADFLGWARGWKEARATLFDAELQAQIETARQKRRALEAFTVKDVRDAEQKAALLAEAEAALERVKLGCDLLVGTRLLGLPAREAEAMQLNLLILYMAGQEQESEEARRALAAAGQVRVFHWEFEFPEVFEHGGFSSFVGNPPFIGGRRVRETLGDRYRDALYQFYPNSSGNADYCAFFFLHGYGLLRKGGTLGLIATNTIAQGDTRQTGLEKIIELGGVIYHATNNYPWPGQAAVAVNVIHMIKGGFRPPLILDQKLVQHISSLLDSREVVGDPKQLMANKNQSFQGSVVVGMGFILEPGDAESLIESDSHNEDVLFPYLNGDDLNSNPNQAPSRWVINFFDWSLEKAQEYSEPMKILREKVYPVRIKVNREAHRKYWWHYGDKRPALYQTIASLDRVLVCSQTTKYLNFVYVPNGWVYAHKIIVFALDREWKYAVLQSSFHDVWARKYCSTLETRLSYTPSDGFETFPFPSISLLHLESLGENYHEHRRQLMLARQEGLTATYNRFHNPKDAAADITRLRALHVEMDHAVAAAYGWQDLELGHGFHETAQGVRFTISEAARREVLGRLLKLNHERYEEEVKLGMHEKGGKKGAKGTKKSKKHEGQMGLF